LSTKQSTRMAQGQAPKKPAGQVDVERIIAEARAKIPPQLRAMFDKVVLSGERIMFDKSSYHMTEDMLNQPGPLATRISNGIITLVYMLWDKSNKTIPPQLIVPATLVLTLRAFQFLQESKDPEATSDVLGEAVADAVQGVMDRFGATQDKIPALVKGQQGAQPGAQPAQPEAGGLLAAATGAPQ
jgi:hypothetical protein